MARSDQAALLADPDAYFQIALGAVLKKGLDFSTIVEATTFGEALDCLAQQPSVSLAVFEFSLPGVTTGACFAAVREHYPAVKTVIVSNSERRQDVLLALEAGAHGFVPKHVGPAQLAEALKTILDGRIYVPPLIAALSSAEDIETARKRLLKGKVSEVLTPRQRAVLQQLVQGKSNKEIAKTLDLSAGTIKVHMAALFRVLGVNSRTAAAALGGQLLANPKQASDGL